MEIAKHWKTIVDTLPDGLRVLDSEGNILAMNPAAEKLTGYSAAELIGRNCRTLNCTGCELFGRGSGEQWCSLYVKGKVKAKKCLISKKDRRALHVVKNAAVLRDSEGRTLGAVETFTDISEIVRQQQEIETLFAYHWPGNVGELRNAIEYAFVLCSGGWIGREHLPPKIAVNGKNMPMNSRQNAESWEKERIKLINALHQVGGNQSEAARILGVSRVTIWKRIKKYGIHLSSDLKQ